MATLQDRSDERPASSIDRQPDVQPGFPLDNGEASQVDVQAFLEFVLMWHQAELPRVDAKCSALLGLESAAMALLLVFATGSTSLETLPRVALVVSIVLLAASLVALLVMLRPRALLRGPLRQAALAAAPDGDQLLKMVDHELAGKDPLLWRSNLLGDFAVHMQVRTRQVKLALNLLLAFIGTLSLVPVLQVAL